MRLHKTKKLAGLSIVKRLGEFLWSNVCFLFLLDCERYFLYFSLIDIAEDEGIVQRLALFHRLLDMCHLAIGKYILEKE